MAIYNNDENMSKKYTTQGIKEDEKQGGQNVFKKPGEQKVNPLNQPRKTGQETTSNPKGPYQANH